MSDITSLRSYLVGLGFSVNTSEFNKFKGVLGDAAKITDFSVGSIAKDVIKWQATITGMFLAVSAAIVGTIDKVATADQDYRLFGERMFMDTKHARSMKIAMDALGHSLDEIAFDPELYQRFQLLQRDEANLSAGLGQDFETTMRQIRDVQFEFTRFKVELQFFTMGFVKNLFQQLTGGSGDFAQNLKNINDWIIAKIPIWSQEFATDVVPILKDTWDILKGVGAIVGDLIVDFTNFISVISGDDSIATTTFDFHKFAGAVEHVVHWVAKLVEALEWIERHSHVMEIVGGAIAGGAAGSVIPGVGTLVGAVAGGAAGAGYAGISALGQAGAPNATSDTAGPAGFTASQSGGTSAEARADEARQIAKEIASKYGLSAQLVFAQMEHETGGFKNRGARELNNFAGINVPGGHGQDYRRFDSTSEFADYYGRLLTSKRYRSQGIMEAKTPEEYASALKRGGYMGDSAANYAHGMRSAIPDFYKGSGSGDGGDVYNTHVVVNNPSSTTDVTKGVHDALRQQAGKETQRNLAQFTPAYQ